MDDFVIVSQDPPNRQDSLSNYDDIAQLLIQEKFILTALEFHAELLENGLDLPRLRDYFSNPGNFERSSDIKGEPSYCLPRTSSIQTFDSLDFARYSDDGDRQANDKLAVLEFELRKAQEMIKSLRANLTEAAESESFTMDNYPEYVCEDDTIKSHESRALNYLVNEYLLKYNYKLTSITFSDENSNQDFEDWDDVGLNIPKPPSLLSLYREFGRNVKCLLNFVEEGIQVNPIMQDNFTTIDEEFFNNQMDEKSVIKPSGEDKLASKRESEFYFTNTNESLVETETESNDLVNVSHEPLYEPDCSKTDISHENFNMYTFNYISSKRDFKGNENNPNMTKCEIHFHQLLNNLISRPSTINNNRLAYEIREVVDSHEKIVLLLTRCLPHIVPNVILSKREELLPVILSAISLHPEVHERDKLLNILFNLIKRPDEEQRQIILGGFVAIAQMIGTSRVENELLPQCWEQIGNKYPERRILVAEACGVLIPYITNEMKGSLVLSMLQQMFYEEKIDLVRNVIVQSLAILFAHMHDESKYSLGMGLLWKALHDTSDSVSKLTLKLLLPSFCLWSKKLGVLESNFIPEIIRQLKDILEKTSPTLVDEKNILNLLVDTFLSTISWVFVSVIEDVPSDVVDNNLFACDIDVDRLPPSVSPLCKLGEIIGDYKKCNHLLSVYENYTSQEWYETWPSLDWICKLLVPDLFSLIKKDHIYTPDHIHSLCQLFHWFNRLLGRNFVISHIKPTFKSILKFRDQDKETVQNRISIIQITVPVYACGVLTVFSVEEDRQELAQFLHEVLVMLSLCRLSLTSIEFILTELSSGVGYQDMIFSVLWDGVVHPSPFVRSSSAVLFQIMVRTADEHIMTTKIVPALMALANDPEISVKIATIPTFGSILEKSSTKEILARVEAQLQTFLDDPMYKDQYELRKEIIRLLGQVAPVSDSRFRDEFVLPHLVALANSNNQLHQDVKRTEISLAILDAFLAISGFCTNEKVISELVIPGLKCLLRDIQELAPVHEEIVASLINEFNSKIPNTSLHDRHSSGVTAVVSSSVDEVKNRVGKMFTNRTLVKPNIQNIFSTRKNT